MTQAFAKIRQGLTEAIAQAKGDQQQVKVYQPRAVDVSTLRVRLDLTQEQFAADFIHD